MRFPLSTARERQHAIDYINALPFPDAGTKSRYFADITRKSPPRSHDQNRLYWLWIACICQETGNDKDDVHEEFKRMFLGTERVKIFGHGRNKPRSSKDLNTAQFKVYLDRIQIFANTELSIILPDPDDRYWDSFAERYSPYL